MSAPTMDRPGVTPSPTCDISRCECPRVALTMPAGATIEIAACRVVRLWAATIDQVEAGASCVAELADGSRIACVEAPEALVKGGAGLACGRTHRRCQGHAAESAEEGTRGVPHDDCGVAQQQSTRAHNPPRAGASPAPAIEPHTGLPYADPSTYELVPFHRGQADARLAGPPD